MHPSFRKDYELCSFFTKPLTKSYNGRLQTLSEMPHRRELQGQQRAHNYNPDIDHCIEERTVLNDQGHYEEKVLLSYNDRRTQFNEKAWPNQMIAYLMLEYDDGPYRGSGTFIGPSHILTAAHNVYSKGKWANKVYVAPGQLNDVQPFGVAKAVRCYVLPGWLEGNKKEDLALIIIDQSLGLRTGWAGLIVADDQEIKSRQLLVVGYPGDKSKQLWGMRGDAAAVDPDTLYYNIDTNAGQSGSGVCFREGDDVYVVGVHVRGGKNYNEATRITTANFEMLLQWMSESFAVQENAIDVSLSQVEIRNLFVKARQGYKEELKNLEEEANRGNARAAYYMSCLYNQGVGVEQNTNTAKDWLKKVSRYNIKKHTKFEIYLNKNNYVSNFLCNMFSSQNILI